MLGRPVGDELLGDRLGLLGRDGEADADVAALAALGAAEAGDRAVDADELAVGGDQCSSGVARVDGSGGLDRVGDDRLGQGILRPTTTSNVVTAALFDPSAVFADLVGTTIYGRVTSRPYPVSAWARAHCENPPAPQAGFARTATRRRCGPRSSTARNRPNVPQQGPLRPARTRGNEAQSPSTADEAAYRSPDHAMISDSPTNRCPPE